MQAIGIVCEYNPFHAGHFYQIEESRRLVGADCAVVCAMSGDFVQRGEAAVFSKFARAEAACRSGADLVVELPLPWCLSSAEGFAAGAVSILASLGCTHLSFGSEGGDLEALQRLASFSADPDRLSAIRKHMEQDASLSFARARQLAAEKEFGADAALLSQPNNILAVEYLKAVHCGGFDMIPLAIPRIGSGHDDAGEGGFRSAMQIRELLAKGGDVSEFLTPEAMAVFQRELDTGRVRNERILEAALLSRLYPLSSEDFDRLPDAENGVGRRLHHALWQGKGIEETVRIAVNKRCTAARMRRMLLCAALGVCADDTKAAPPYIRVLAANEKGMRLLRGAAESGRIPLLGKAADARRLGPQADRVFTLTAQAHALYCLQFVAIDDRDPNSDWRQGILFVNNAQIDTARCHEFGQERCLQFDER